MDSASSERVLLCLLWWLLGAFSPPRRKRPPCQLTEFIQSLAHSKARGGMWTQLPVAVSLMLLTALPTSPTLSTNASWVHLLPTGASKGQLPSATQRLVLPRLLQSQMWDPPANSRGLAVNFQRIHIKPCDCLCLHQHEALREAFKQRDYQGHLLQLKLSRVGNGPGNVLCICCLLKMLSFQENCNQV